ncbi:hypothetical protein RB195_012678 [Necator americanus]|uniref:Uncharacterized protein n=1 Tax=Necator americanus TaxID=51031 RepID=A0ABR1DS24_NECAM
MEHGISDQQAPSLAVLNASPSEASGGPTLIPISSSIAPLRKQPFMQLHRAPGSFDSNLWPCYYAIN